MCKLDSIYVVCDRKKKESDLFWICFYIIKIKVTKEKENIDVYNEINAHTYTPLLLSYSLRKYTSRSRRKKNER